MTPVTIVIPVGPEPKHSKYLHEALQSVVAQTRRPDQVILVDDMAGVTEPIRILKDADIYYDVWQAPWRMGLAGAINAGFGLAPYGDLIIQLASDDMLAPCCVEESVRAYESNGCRDGYYWYGIRFIGDAAAGGRQEDMWLPSGACATTKSFWYSMGGHPPESGVGSPDSITMSIMQVHGLGPIIKVESPEPAYIARMLPENDSYQRRVQGWQTIIPAVKNLATEGWRAPQWGRLP